MLRRRPHHILTAWIACFAILLAALAPSIAHAISARQGQLWMEICTAQGVKYVKFDTKAGTSSSTPKASGAEHCPFCVSHGDTYAGPPATALVHPVPSLRQSQPRLFYQAPAPLFIWAPAQSRAPPANRSLT